MTHWYAFTARHEPKAAAELREAGYDAFALMMLDRRRKHRHRGKAEANFKPQPIVALKGYVFVNGYDLWAFSKMRHVRQPVRFCGRMRAIPERELQALLNPRMPFFHDTDVPRFNNRPEPPKVKAGDVVRFTLAAETLDCPVMSVDGESLLVQVRHMLLGRDQMRIPVGLVERVA
jgi:hypothetical protein